MAAATRRSVPAALASPLIDIGANLTSSKLKHTADLLERAAQAGVSHIIVTGTSLAESEHAIRLCRAFAGAGRRPRLYCTVGCHPHEATRHAATLGAVIARFRQLIDDNRDVVVAVGECGLDYDRNFSTPSDQQAVLAAQLDLSIACDLPLFLHVRYARVHVGIVVSASPSSLFRHVATRTTTSAARSASDRGAASSTATPTTTERTCSGTCRTGSPSASPAGSAMNARDAARPCRTSSVRSRSAAS